jgi:hypothetical protein
VEPREARLQPDRARTLQQALTATAEELFQLLLTPDREILQVLLKNPRITEDHLLALLKRRDLPEPLLRSIHQRCADRLSHRLVVALVKNPNLPAVLLRSLLPQLRLFELVDLCFLPGLTPDQKLAAERTILRRLPTTPLGNKMTLARRATAPIVAEILREGDARLVAICLDSPRLSEATIFQFVNSPQATAATLSMVARHQRWKDRPNLQQAILKNRQTPQIWFTLWLPKLPLARLNRLAAGGQQSPTQKKALEEELQRRHATR